MPENRHPSALPQGFLCGRSGPHRRSKRRGEQTTVADPAAKTVAADLVQHDYKLALELNRIK